jgi:hypothetical protein
MFDKHKLSRDGAQAQALVLEKKIYATEVESGMTSACRYDLRVKFEDGSTTEISRRAFGHTLASASVGDVIPVRYDSADRSKIELDRQTLVERQKAEAHDRTPRRLRGGKRRSVCRRLRRRPCPLPTSGPRTQATFASATPIGS